MSRIAHCRQQTAGFTLVEILIVVVIIGILAAVVIPQFVNATQSASQAAFADSLRSYAKAAMIHMGRTGELVSDSSSGVCPVELEPYVDKGKFEAGTPLGGVWDFEQDGFAGAGMGAGVGVHFNDGSNPGDVFMAQIDDQLDDGDLSTGGFRKIDSDRYYMLLMR